MSADVRSEPEPTEEEIVKWVAERYGVKFAGIVRSVLDNSASPSFARHVRASLIRDMRR